MLYKDNKAYVEIVNGATVPFLPTYAPQNGERLNERKKKSVRLSGIYYKLAEELEDNSKAEAMKKRAGRVYGCCSTRELAINSEGYALTIESRRCRDRHCVDCARVRAFCLQQKIRDITPALIAETDPGDALIFGTLTIKNPPITDLKLCLKVMSKAFARMLARKDFKVILGGFRCFEVTRGEAGSELCHPHIHFLLQVKKGYFPTTSPLYIKNDKWAEAWTDCLDLEFKKHNEAEEKKYIKSLQKEEIKDQGKLEDLIKITTENNKKAYVKNTFNFNRSDYPNGRAFVKILRVQTPESARQKLKNPKYATIGTLQTEGDQVINYVLKYTAKEDENSPKALVKNDQWFKTYDEEIKNIRAISFFGVYKTLIAKIEDREYDEKDIKAGIENNGENKFYSAIYDDDHNYILIKTTEAEALEKKRFNMVKSAFNTLKIQLESKIKVLDIIEQSIKKRDIFKTQEEIDNINKLSERIFKTFKRLEKLGEVKEEKSGFNQALHNYNFIAEIYRPISDVLNPEKIAEIERIRREILEAVEVFDMTDNLPF